MNDQEINRKLALAIGWKPRFICEAGGKVFCKLLLYKDPFWERRCWRVRSGANWQGFAPELHRPHKRKKRPQPGGQGRSGVARIYRRMR